MSDRNMTITFASSLSDITERNASFDSGVLRVAYTGKNRNNSFISKETFEQCIPSMSYCPVVCRYDRESDTIGAHDQSIVCSDSGAKLVNLTQPVGVVPGGDSFHYWWEDIQDDSGIHEYLCTDVLLWKRQEAYEKIKRDGITAESMEITIRDGKLVDGVYIIDRFEFSAFCLLGTAEPCFESAALEMFSCDEIKSQFAEMMRELKETFAFEVRSAAQTDIDNQFKKGVEKELEDKIALMKEYGFKSDSLGFSLEDFSLDELREKFNAMKAEADFALESQTRCELARVVESEKVELRWGEDSRYWFDDYDKDISEVYAYDMVDGNLCGFTYSMDGDHAVIDFDSKKRMKIVYQPYDEGSQGGQPSPMFAKMCDWFDAHKVSTDTQLEEKYNTVVEQLNTANTELDTLRKFKADADEAAEQAKRDEVFAEFGDLENIDAFSALKERAADYSADDLRKECYAIRGMNVETLKFSYKNSGEEVRLPVEKHNSGVTADYGGLFEKYGYEPAN